MINKMKLLEINCPNTGGGKYNQRLPETRCKRNGVMVTLKLDIKKGLYMNESCLLHLGFPKGTDFKRCIESLQPGGINSFGSVMSLN